MYKMRKNLDAAAPFGWKVRGGARTATYISNAFRPARARIFQPNFHLSTTRVARHDIQKRKNATN